MTWHTDWVLVWYSLKPPGGGNKERNYGCCILPSRSFDGGIVYRIFPHHSWITVLWWGNILSWSSIIFFLSGGGGDKHKYNSNLWMLNSHVCSLLYIIPAYLSIQVTSELSALELGLNLLWQIVCVFHTTGVVLFGSTFVVVYSTTPQIPLLLIIF